jgi:hypothetical protein
MIVNHRQLQELLQLHIKTGQSLMIRGEPGIGKTEAVEAAAATEAKRLNLKLVNWNMLTTADKRHYQMDAEARRSSYFLSMVDLLSKLPEDLGGLPQTTNDYMEWVPDLQFWVLSQPETHGLCFFDELMQAQQAVQKPVANVFLKKVLGTTKLSDHVSVMAASNRKEDRCGVIDMLEHLKNRMSHIDLASPTAQNWVDDYALPQDLDTRCIGYLMFRPTALSQRLEHRKQDAYPSPRSWAIAARMIAHIPTSDRTTIEMVMSSRIGDAEAAGFDSFLQLRDRIDCEACIADPETKLPPLPLDQKLAYVTWAVEQIGRKEYLDKAVHSFRHLGRDDISIMGLHVIKNKLTEEKLRKLLMKSDFDWVRAKYAKYLLT